MNIRNTAPFHFHRDFPRGGISLSATVAGAMISAVFAGAMLFSSSCLAQEEITDPAQQKRLMDLLVQDCGSCHGLHMKGGLGPELTQEALKDRSRDYLVALVRGGVPGTAMPPWGPLLTETEAQWIVDRIMKGEITP